LLNNTTNEEKTNIRSLNYKYLWQIVFGAEANINSPRYRDLEHQFRIRFNQEIIDRLLINTSNVDMNWDIPRGRKKRGEKELDCAFREFYEETGIPPTDYTILSPDFFITHKITTRTTTYVNIYYPAKMRNASKHLDRTMKFYLPSDFNEIQGVRWVNFNQIDSFINPNIKYIFTEVNNDRNR
jgi:8-oxo-dGTP pyrophosphatase MutT (NUDIX family)